MSTVALTPRRQHMLTGAIALVLLLAVTTVGIKGAFGAYTGGYELVGTFDAAGQGLLPGSDVKIRGVNIGEVRRIELVGGQALLTLRIEDDERVPVDATAVIRPKTLFGEKFVDIDPGEAEATGPFLADGDELVDTQGGFELEQVLGDTYPLLQAIDPAELMTVVGELAEGGQGLGETVNRTLVNSAELGEVFAGNIDNTSAFLRDLALLSDQLAADADDLLALADAGNVALPTINEREDDVVALLEQAGRLSTDVADLLEANEPFVRSAMVEGSRTLQLLFDQRQQVVPLVVGLRQYVQTLSEVIRIDVGNGTLMAAVKGILGADACGALPCGQLDLAPSGPSAPTAGPEAPPLVPELPLDVPLDLDDDTTGDLSDLLGRVLGG
jgi:phospholipid/cholesterol/gamma-HCH transport system substrate-binding protein